MAFFRNLSVISHSIHILGKVMGTVIDHLSANHYISVLQDFTDARQGAHRKGEKGCEAFRWQRRQLNPKG